MYLSLGLTVLSCMFDHCRDKFLSSKPFSSYGPVLNPRNVPVTCMALGFYFLFLNLGDFAPDHADLLWELQG